jgi:7-carboxy-7-deazaguanine synthase
MSYALKEIFETLQGEGAHAGRVAAFCRFSFGAAEPAP